MKHSEVALKTWRLRLKQTKGALQLTVAWIKQDGEQCEACIRLGGLDGPFRWVVDWGNGQPDVVSVGSKRIEVERDRLPSEGVVELKIHREDDAENGFSVTIGDEGFVGLDVRDNPLLQELYCDKNSLWELYVRNPVLKVLVCGCNHLSKLDISGSPALERLSCEDNRLSDL